MTREEAKRQLEYLSVCSENHVTTVVNSRDSQAIDMAIKALEQTEQRWIPVSEKLPEDNREVQVTCEVRRCDGKKYRYTCHASYVHRYSIESTDYCNWEDCDEYNEEEDKYYALAGWYERVHNWDDCSYCAIEDFVIAWRNLPEPYGGEQDENTR